MSTNCLSDYYKSLDANVAERYRIKLELINNEDPYCLPREDFQENFNVLPKITFIDLVQYLVFTKSFYTNEDFKAHKSMEAYNQFVCGWVREFGHKQYMNHWLLMAKVCHSQSFNSTLLVPWVIVDNTGSVISGHCTCMAGLAEACTHIGALLFFVEFGIRNWEAVTVTDELAYWPVPSAKTVPPSRIRDIDFSTPQEKRRKLEELVDGPSSSTKKLRQSSVSDSTPEEIQTINTQIFQTGVKSAFLSVTRDFQQSFKTVQNVNLNSSIDLRLLHNTEHNNLSAEGIKSLSYTTILTISQEEAVKIEKVTRAQSKCKKWYQYRAGRITASKFKSACHTKTPTSSPSLIKSICYPDTVHFKSNATTWGCVHEKTARQQYVDSLAAYHEGCVVSDIGLVINPKYPHFGATPDAAVYCDCCGAGVLEIKCPYCVKDCPIEDLIEKKGGCLEMNDSNERELNKNHAYYYQVQAQLFITERHYADFMVWTTVGEAHIERIYRDVDFWEVACKKATKFFREGILPEMLAKFVSRNCQSIVEQGMNELCMGDLEHICICKGEFDNSKPVIMCMKRDCAVQWFHVECLKLKKVPKKYICNSCTAEMKRRKE